jgi:PEGA domain-containing protein
MAVRLIVTAFAMACYLSLPAAAFAQHGGHGGGHSSGGHSGGHSSAGSGGSTGGGHASSAHDGGSRNGGGQSHGDESHGARAARSGSPVMIGRPAPIVMSHGGAGAFGNAVSRRRDLFIAPPLFYSSFRASFVQPRFRFGQFGPIDPFASFYRYGSVYPGGLYAASPEYSDYADPNDAYAADNQPTPSVDSGNLRMLIDPPTAQVFVDGVFVGMVEEAGSPLAGVRLEAGPHRVEFRAPGYEPLTVDVMIGADRTITYRAQMQRLPPQ